MAFPLPQPQLFEPPEEGPIPVPFGDWTPDQPDFENVGSPSIVNALVASSRSYGPMASLAQVVNAGLTLRCQGGCGFVDGSGNVNLFAGDAQDLYQLTKNSGAFSTVSNGTHPYSVNQYDQWRFEYFNGQVIATQLGNPIQAFTLGSSTAFSALAAAAPQAKYIASIKDSFLCVANTWDSVGGYKQQRVWWSSSANATSWPTPGTAAAAQVQSGYVDLLNSLGQIQGLVGGLANADGAVFMEHGVRRMLYVGPPLVFDFIPCQGVRGTAAPGSIVSLSGGLVFYYGEDGFYMFDGATATPIGLDKIDQWFAKNCMMAYLWRMVGVADPLSRNVFWAFPGWDSTDGSPTQMLVYNWGYNKWTLVKQPVEMLAKFIGIGYTLDQLYTLFGWTVDQIPAPLDSNIWVGGRYNFGAFDLGHRLNYATGPALQATLMTKEIEIFPGKRSLCRAGRPLADGGDPLLSIGKRDRMEDPVVYTNAVAMNSYGTSNPRCSGRYLRGVVTMPAGATWNHAIGVELDCTEQKGKR